MGCHWFAVYVGKEINARKIATTIEYECVNSVPTVNTNTMRRHLFQISNRIRLASANLVHCSKQLEQWFPSGRFQTTALKGPALVRCSRPDSV